MRKTFILLTVFLSVYCSKSKFEENVLENVFNTFVIHDIKTLNPHNMFDIYSSSVVKNIYESLIDYDLKTMKIKPLLAKEWEYKDNGKKLIFFLRDDVFFHDDPCFPGGKGRKFTAKDVKYSYERNNNKNAIGSQFLRGIKGFDAQNLPEKSTEIEGIKVVDDFIIEFTFNEPNSTFLPALNRTFGYIVPKEAVEYYGSEFKYHAVGTGPFKLYRWENNGDIILHKNKKYWEKDKSGRRLPYLDGIVVKLVKVPILRLTQFTNGELDVLDINKENFSVVFKDTLLTLNDFFNEMGCKVVASRFSFSTQSIQYTRLSEFKNTELDIKNVKKLWNSTALRRALSFAIDREAIISDILGTWSAIPAKGEFPPGFPAYDENYKGYYYDPVKARKLLKEAGYPGGKGLDVFKIVLPEGIHNSKIGKYVKRNLAEIGINVEIYQVPYSEKSEFVRKIGAELHLDGWTIDYPDAMGFFEPSSVDMTPEFAKKVYCEVNTDKRNELLKEFDRLMGKKCLNIYLFHRRGPIRVVHKNIQNYILSPMLHNDLKYVRKN